MGVWVLGGGAFIGRGRLLGVLPYTTIRMSLPGPPMCAGIFDNLGCYSIAIDSFFFFSKHKS